MIDFKLAFALTSGLIVIAAYFPYLRSIYIGETKPHIYTWLIWLVTSGIATAGLWYGGGGFSAYSMTLGWLLIVFVLASSFRYGTRNITFTDTVLLVLALGAVLVWWQLQTPLYALIMATVIDAVGYIPTMRKSFAEPWSESVMSWSMFTASGVFAILGIAEYNILTTLFLSMTITANIILITICLMRRRAVPRPLT